MATASQTDDMTDSSFEDDYPRKLEPERIAENRAEMVQLLYEEPRRQASWYADRVGVWEKYLGQLHRDFPRVFEREKDPEDGRRYLYSLSDDAIAAFKERGIIDPDDVSDLANSAEEPSARQRRSFGNVSYEGPPIDLTGEDPQTIHERPVKGDPDETDDDPDETDTGGEESAANDDDAPDDPPEDETDETDAQPGLTATLSPEDAFEIIRNGPREESRRLFESLVGQRPR